MKQAVDRVGSLVPLLLERHLASQARGLDISRIQIAVADDLNLIDAGDLLPYQLKNRRAEVAGDPAVCTGILQAVLEKDVRKASVSRAEPAQKGKRVHSSHALAPDPFVLDSPQENPSSLCFRGEKEFAFGRNVSGHRHQVFPAREISWNHLAEVAHYFIGVNFALQLVKRIEQGTECRTTELRVKLGPFQLT